MESSEELAAYIKDAHSGTEVYNVNAYNNQIVCRQGNVSKGYMIPFISLLEILQSSISKTILRQLSKLLNSKIQYFDVLQNSLQGMWTQVKGAQEELDPLLDLHKRTPGTTYGTMTSSRLGTKGNKPVTTCNVEVEEKENSCQCDETTKVSLQYR